MPKAFTSCVKRGGRVRTKTYKGGYIHVCFIGGKSHAGHPHKAKKKGRK